MRGVIVACSRCELCHARACNGVPPCRNIGTQGQASNQPTSARVAEALTPPPPPPPPPPPLHPHLCALDAQRVDLVHKDDAGRVDAGALEQIAHTCRAHTHDRLNKLAVGRVGRGAGARLVE